MAHSALPWPPGTRVAERMPAAARRRGQASCRAAHLDVVRRTDRAAPVHGKSFAGVLAGLDALVRQLPLPLPPQTQKLKSAVVSCMSD